MKRFRKAAVFLALCMVLALAGCGEQGNAAQPNAAGNAGGSAENSAGNAAGSQGSTNTLSRPQNTAGNTNASNTGLLHRDNTAGNGGGIEIGSGLAGAPTVDSLLLFLETGEGFEPHALTEAEKAALKEDVAKQGGSVEFGADGSIIVKGEDRSWFRISLDGSVEGEDEDGKPIKKLVSGDWPTDGLWAAIPDPGYETNSLLVDEHAVMVSFKVQDNAYEMAKEYAEKLKAAGFTQEAEETDMKDMGVYIYSASGPEGINVSLMLMQGQGFMLNADDGTDLSED